MSGRDQEESEEKQREEGGREGMGTGVHGVNVIARNGMNRQLRFGNDLRTTIPLKHILGGENEEGEEERGNLLMREKEVRESKKELRKNEKKREKER